MNIETSPFYDEWKNQAEAERYRISAREYLEHCKTYQAASRAGHMDYGKWLIASLLAVHGGSIYAISSIRNSVGAKQIPGLIDAAAFNLGGIFMVLVAGFFAWLNLQAAESLYNKWNDSAVLYRSDMFQRDDGKTDLVTASIWGAAAFGLMSGFMFLASAVTVVNTLKL
ncbi:hypothetical protein DSM25558_0171 [Agrobacterium sp. DSM 25558]|uniref:hypothetical protein n=1 Tax=Agrobacterium sp. DSM 25558 TaxID=1907665 RepID=UPI000972454A|nr:hypothetical protein [Agrobacterium sp. DSM 25558]SCX00745.1 hypothetical protein DSM25558_0171 [Agrobacterium sp. DSM 25558]